MHSCPYLLGKKLRNIGGTFWSGLLSTEKKDCSKEKCIEMQKQTMITNV